MVRKRSWPAVSHCKKPRQSLHPYPSLCWGEGPHDLQLHGLAIELDRPDLLFEGSVSA